MNDNALWSHIGRHITSCQPLGQSHSDRPTAVENITGGDTSQAYCLELGDARYFVKVHNANMLPMFEAEALALTKLQPFAPPCLCTGAFDGDAYAVFDYTNMSQYGDENQLGRVIAELHDDSRAHTLYGWYDDNFIGNALQQNNWQDDWATFWWQQRLLPQLEKAQEQGYQAITATISPLEEATHQLLDDHSPRPCLLHGDLWSGNKAFQENGEPVIFDPASYYGDRECDVAMTEMFGGFSAAFYRSYYRIHPQRPGYALRKRLYNLYHYLNHLNLFGESYLTPSLNHIAALTENDTASSQKMSSS